MARTPWRNPSHDWYKYRSFRAAEGRACDHAFATSSGCSSRPVHRQARRHPGEHRQARVRVRRPLAGPVVGEPWQGQEPQHDRGWAAAEAVGLAPSFRLAHPGRHGRRPGSGSGPGRRARQHGPTAPAPVAAPAAPAPSSYSAASGSFQQCVIQAESGGNAAPSTARPARAACTGSCPARGRRWATLACRRTPRWPSRTRHSSRSTPSRAAPHGRPTTGADLLKARAPARIPPGRGFPWAGRAVSGRIQAGPALRLVEQQAGRHREVERLGGPRHRDAHADITPGQHLARAARSPPRRAAGPAGAGSGQPRSSRAPAPRWSPP